QAADDRRDRTRELVQNGIVKKTGAAFARALVDGLEVRESVTNFRRTGWRDQLAHRTRHRVGRKKWIPDRNRCRQVTRVRDLILEPLIRSHAGAVISRLVKRQHIAARA